MRGLAILVTILCIVVAAHLIMRMFARLRRRTALRRMDDLLVGNAHVAAAVGESREVTLPGFLLRRLARAGWEPERSQIAMLVAVYLAIAAGAMLFTGVLIGILVALTVALTGWVVLEYRGSANMRVLAASMLGLLERIRQLLSVGNSLPVALQRAVENSSPIVSRCLASTIRRINNGGGVAESIERCADDLDMYELHLLATATRTNLRFGGSMTNILKNIIENIRKRSSIERELRSNTTQIRASAWVLALLPILVASVVMFTNPGYGRWFLATAAGHAMIVYAIVSQLLGGLCMRFIVRTRF